MELNYDKIEPAWKVWNILLQNNLVGNIPTGGINYNISDGFFSVKVDWGDWKHTHLAIRDVLSKNGYGYEGSITTEENGTDCYSAIHYFKYK